MIALCVASRGKTWGTFYGPPCIEPVTAIDFGLTIVMLMLSEMHIADFITPDSMR